MRFTFTVSNTLFAAVLLFQVGCTTGAPTQMGVAPTPSGGDNTGVAAKACGPGEFSCGANDACIASTQLCNGVNDCAAGQDEEAGLCERIKQTTATQGACKPTEFACGDGQCVPAVNRCDGTAQCTGALVLTAKGADESGCAAAPGTPVAGALTCEQQGKVSCTAGNSATVCFSMVCPDGQTCSNSIDTCPAVSCEAQGKYTCPLNTDNAGLCTNDISLSKCNNVAQCLAGQVLCNDNNCYNNVCNGQCQNAACAVEETTFTCAELGMEQCGAEKDDCYLGSWACDGYNDCTNGFDEGACGTDPSDDPSTCEYYGLVTCPAGTLHADSCDYSLGECNVPYPAVCGNGQVQTGEACDDGNTISGDGCSSSCQTETAGIEGCGGGYYCATYSPDGCSCSAECVTGGDCCSDYQASCAAN